MVACSRCHELKYLKTEFYKSKTSKSGFEGVCKKCRDDARVSYFSRPDIMIRRAEYGREWRKKNPERQKAIEMRRKITRKPAVYDEAARLYRAKWYQDNKQRAAETGHQRYLRHKNDIRNKDLMKSYNLTVEQFELRLKQQNGKCAACGTDSPAKWNVDHDHACCSGAKSCGNCIRGILCSHCNSALGMVKDNPDTLQKLISYLASSSVVKKDSGVVVEIV